MLAVSLYHQNHFKLLKIYILIIIKFNILGIVYFNLIILEQAF